MVKIPKEIKRYCPYCRKHTTHRVKEESTGRTSPFRKTHRKRQRQIEKGYGSFPYEDPSHRSRGRKNPSSEKKNLKLRCEECGKEHKPKKPIRTTKLEIE